MKLYILASTCDEELSLQDTESVIMYGTGYDELCKALASAILTIKDMSRRP